MAMLTDNVKNRLRTVYSSLAAGIRVSMTSNEFLEVARQSFTSTEVDTLDEAIVAGKKVTFMVQARILFNETVAPKYDGTYETFYYNNIVEKATVAFGIHGESCAFDVTK